VEGRKKVSRRHPPFTNTKLKHIKMTTSTGCLQQNTLENYSSVTGQASFDGNGY